VGREVQRGQTHRGKGDAYALHAPPPHGASRASPSNRPAASADSPRELEESPSKLPRSFAHSPHTQHGVGPSNPQHQPPGGIPPLKAAPDDNWRLPPRLRPALYIPLLRSTGTHAKTHDGIQGRLHPPHAPHAGGGERIGEEAEDAVRDIGGEGCAQAV